MKTLTQTSGLSASLSELGATLRTLSITDRDGKLWKILVGLGTPEEWLINSPFFGCNVGHYANRIAGKILTR